MELIDRYIYAVSTYLPLKQQADIEKELRGLIEDMLMEKTNGSVPTAQQVEEVLAELGEPSQLAEKYQDRKRYLIGPELYGKYLSTLKLVMSIVLPLAALIGTAVITFQPFESIGTTVREYIETLISVAAGVVFWVTLVFIILERVGTGPVERLVEKPWKPSDLPPVEAKRLIPIGDAIFGMVYYALMLGAFIFADSLIGAHMKDAGGYRFTPLFNSNILNAYLPVLFALFGLSLLKEAAKLFIGRWTVPLWTANLILNVSMAIAFAAMLTNSNILNGGFIDLVANLTETSGNRIAEISGYAVRGLAIVIVFFCTWDIAATARKLRRVRRKVA